MLLPLKVLFILLLAGFTAPAMSTEEKSVKFHNNDSFYLGFKLGNTRFQHGCQSLAVDCDKRDQSSGFYAGYHLNEHLALEFSYADLGEVNARYTEYGRVNNYSSTMEGFDLGLLAQYPLTSKLSVFAKVGAFKWEGTNKGPLTTLQDDDWSNTLSAGFRYQFNQHWRARFSYQLIDELGSEALGSSNGHIAWIGVSYQFGQQPQPLKVVSTAKKQKVVTSKSEPVIIPPKLITLPALTAKVIFDFDQTNFNETDQLVQLVEHLTRYPKATVNLIGHTDSSGSKSYNMALSAKRANQVASYLVDKGVLTQQITQQFKGYDHPVIDNLTPLHRQQNRRVTLTVNAIQIEVE